MQRRSRSRSHASGEEGSTTAADHLDTPLSLEHHHVGHAALHHAVAARDSDVAASSASTSGSSIASLASSEMRMSANPRTEIEERLRLHDQTSPATDRSSVSSSASFSLQYRSGQGMAQHGEQEGRSRRGSAEKTDFMLPENDGMRALREKMHEIRTLAISTEEKAKRMHLLMTQDYLAHKASSPMLSTSGNRDPMVEEEPAALDVGLAALPIDPSNPYNLREGDLEVSWSPLPPNPRDEDEDMEGSAELELPNLGCRHYKRNVKIQCFDCHRWFPCRHCHDAAQDLPFPHNLRRKLTKNMLCMICQTPQPAAEECLNCGEYAAYYYCPKCKLWDNDSNKRIYHCDDCGICRVGEGLGKDFVHCKRCNVCISISTSADHPCVEGATERDCPLCLDHLFESRDSVVSMPCGHYMHGDCYKELMRVTYKCPVCSKSAVNMELQWRKLDDEIRAQPMPEDEDELRNLLPHMGEQPGEDTEGQFHPNRSPSLQPRRPRSVYVGCNDCGRRSWTPFHWLGAKCAHCDSYNTNQMAPPAGHETEAERLIRQQQLHRHHDFTGERVLLDAGIQPAEQRADSPLEMPTSPSQLAVPGSPGSPHSSASGLPSPRRYFVQDDDDAEPRRPSFAARGFSTPSLPHLPDLPRLPRMPNLPQMPNLPRVPEWPTAMPEWRQNLPNVQLPHLDIPRFSPYGVMDSLSRSLSPMRYYLQGLDMRDDGVLGRERVVAAARERERDQSPTSVKSDPTDGVTAEKRRVMSDELSDDDELSFWGSRARALAARAGGKVDDEQAIEDESEEGESESSSEEEEDDDDDDVEMRDEADDDEDDDDDEDELALLGHR